MTPSTLPPRTDPAGFTGRQPATGRRPATGLLAVLTGLLVTAAGVALAILLNHVVPYVGPLTGAVVRGSTVKTDNLTVVPYVGPLTGAVVLGALLPNLGLHLEALRPGTRFAARRLLRLGVVLLGLQLAVPQVLRLGAANLLLVVAVVLATFFGTQWLGARLGVSRGQSLLVATGFALFGLGTGVHLSSLPAAGRSCWGWCRGYWWACWRTWASAWSADPRWAARSPSGLHRVSVGSPERGNVSATTAHHLTRRGSAGPPARAGWRSP
ncbi:MAG: putative sulfate exporter family transporter [Dermatophilaceae bacterium]